MPRETQHSAEIEWQLAADESSAWLRVERRLGGKRAALGANV